MKRFLSVVATLVLISMLIVVSFALPEEIDVTYGSTPTVDGSISVGEYTDAHSVTFATSGGTCTVYFKHNGSSLYVAFDVPNNDTGSAVQIFVDTNYDRAGVPQTDDYRFSIRIDGKLAENQGTGTGWNPTVWDSAVGWTGARQKFASAWDAEFAIPYAKLGITAGVAKTIGISFWNAWAQSDYRWPTAADWATPSTWGTASSSDNWAAAPLPPPPMYWKENFTDYAPSGVPDFDQRQDAWWNPWLWPNWSWCAPAAVANSLWWMDSRYENSATPPPAINDTFPLVTNYTTGIDDHDPANVVPFIKHLAYLMDTDGQRTGIFHVGTWVWDMETGIAQYLSWTGLNPPGDVNGDGIVDATDLGIVSAALGSNVTGGVPSGPWNMAADIWPETVTGPYTADNTVDNNDLNLVTANMNKNGMFYEQTLPAPDLYFVEDEVERCEDVVLLLGFYYEIDGYWERADAPYEYESGHAVTVAGVNSTAMQIAISDPIQDAFEAGLVPGRSPVPHIHVPPGNTSTHNNASLVSHDIYNVTWAPPGVLANFTLLNYSSPQAVGLLAAVEWAVIVSPIEVPPPPPVGGIWIPVDKLDLLAPYIALASTILVATAATAIYVKRREKKQ